MKFTALVATVALVLSGALLAGCDRDGNRSASGGGSSSGATGQTPKGAATGAQSEGSTQPGGAPKRPSSPGAPGGK